MKKLSLLLGFILCLLFTQAQQFVQYSADSSRIKYATFREAETRGMSSEDFFSSFLQLDPQNRFVPSDTFYSPDSSYTYIKYRQQYSGYEAEGAMVTLTYHNHSIIRFNGYYIPANNLQIRSSFLNEDAIAAFKQYYNTQNDSCEYFVSKRVAYNPLSKQAQLCFQVQCTDSALYNKILYVSTDDLSFFKENDLPGAGFNATFYTQYNGVRSGYNTCYPWNPPTFVLKDPIAAVEILKLGSNVINISAFLEGAPNTFYNSTNIWGYYPGYVYPNYVLDAYWSASEYSYYMQNTYGVSRKFFQRYWKSGQYLIHDSITPIIIASNTYVDNTCWKQVEYRPGSKDLPQYVYSNVIIIGAPGTAHNPKASIDETVHEFAHIFSYQIWNHEYHSPLYNDDALAEACADIWAAIITSKIYPNEEDKIWKIGEDIVLPTSGYTCVRNLANPSDEHAETQMFSDNCQSTEGDAYERSGVISHWFYLLTHGYFGTGCNGMCYDFPAIPVDSAAKLLFCCETEGFYNGMDYSDVCRATLDAAENFSNPESIRESVLGAWNVVGVRPYYTGIGQFGLSYSSNNNSIYTVDKDLVIDSSRTLTIKGTVRLGDTCSIIILPGSKLVLDGGTLTSACSGELWQGIEVIGDRTKRQFAIYQGTVELKNGAVIENAHFGIHTGYRGAASYATAGGIILADSAFFINNRCAVAFISYENTTGNGTIVDNLSHFYRCEFTVNDNNLFAQNYCQFIDHVTMWDVRGVLFKGCRFSNFTTVTGNRHHAIYTEDAGFQVGTYCRAQYSSCECPENQSVRCEFSGFTTAVEANTTNNQQIVMVDQAFFRNNDIGLEINGNNFAIVTSNDFNLQNMPSNSGNTGLYLNNCSGYQVEGNRFHRAGLPYQITSTGIRVNNSGTSDNSIYRNIFDTLNYGIYVSGTNGNTASGLQMLCGDFSGNVTDICHATTKTTVSPLQGSPQISAGNTFHGTSSYNIENTSSQSIVYFYTGKASAGNSYYPNLRTITNVLPYVSNTANSCASTLCNGGSTPRSLAGFQSGMDSYSAALSDENTDVTYGGTVEMQNVASLQTLRQTLSDTYYAAVREIMSDTVLDLNELEQWHTAAHSANLANYANIGDPYSLTETRFMLGYSEPFTADAEDAEMANYAEFHALKLALRDNIGGTDSANGASQQDGQNSSLETGGGAPVALPLRINWYALTDGQIAQLQTIAERNTGRASVMAKGVLCFFFGICYEDDLLGDDNMDNQDNNMETRSAKVPQQEGETNLTVYPNPTDDVLFIELRGGAEIANVALYDLQGRIVETVPTARLHGTATIDMKSIPSGVYVLRVTDTDGKEYHQKIVRK